MENTNPQTEKYIRPSWDEYFMNIASQVASRATCDRGRSGCVIAKNKQILATGYVGSPIGLAHCDQIGHQLHSVTHEDGHVSQHCIRTTHAEQNAICQAAKLGIALDGATLYCKMTPCYVCAKMIINVGIKRVVCEKDYHAGDLSKEIFKQAGVELMIINPLIEQYDHQ
ncbi:MAG TPA: cytidine/deoxycytidylate deaminase family protein [bacterium]|nr:cytidine/deoxycytidylate deaminase family protein [bacterium]